MNKILLAIAAAAVATACTATKEINMASAPQRGFHSSRPAVKWEESLVTGNGTLGAMVEGNPYHENVVLNHALLYMPLNPPLKPVSQGKHLEQVRQMLFDGRYSEASQFIVDLSKTEGYGGIRFSDPYIPAFNLNIDSDSLGTDSYARTVDFASGVVEVKWHDAHGTFSRKVFASRPDSVVVIRLLAADGATINTALSLSKITEYDDWWINTFKFDEKYGIEREDYAAADRALTWRAWYQWPWDGSFRGYEGVVKVAKADGQVRADGNRLLISGATDVLLLARVAPSADMNHSAIDELLNGLDALPADYDQLLRPHQEVHSELFGRVSLNLNASAADRALSAEQLLDAGGQSLALIEKLFDASRYNILSATGTNPPNLQGIWGATMTPPWSSDHTTNGNLPVAISHYLQANTPELMLPLFDRLEYFMDDFKTNAQELFGCRGIYIPSHFATHGLNNHFDATWPMTFWTVAAAWYSMFYYDYYLYTQDLDFLRNRALPFMEQSALFYEDFLIEGPDGRVVFCPSYSPENNPANSPSQACINATMEVMGVNALLRAIIEASNTLGVNQDKIAVWQSMLERMPQYELNSNGEIREWLWGDLQDNHHHRHASQLFGLYDLHDPVLMADEALREGCKRAADRRMEIRRQENGGVMAFGMVQLAFATAALGEAATTYDILTWLGNCYWNNNMVSTHDPGNTFNVDISGGYPSLVMKMLVYSEPGQVSLLPCLPSQWPSGSIKGVALRGGIIMEELSWNEAGVKATFISQSDQTVNITLKGQQKGKIDLKAGQMIEYQSE